MNFQGKFEKLPEQKKIIKEQKKMLTSWIYDNCWSFVVSMNVSRC